MKQDASLTLGKALEKTEKRAKDGVLLTALYAKKTYLPQSIILKNSLDPEVTWDILSEILFIFHKLYTKGNCNLGKIAFPVIFSNCTIVTVASLLLELISQLLCSLFRF